MINKYGLGVLVVSVAVMTSANEQIDQAIDDLMANSCLTNRRVASHVAEEGFREDVPRTPVAHEQAVALLHVRVWLDGYAVDVLRRAFPETASLDGVPVVP